MNIVPLIAVAASYFYYNWFFFRFSESLLREKSFRPGFVVLAFILNYLIFMVCSYLNLHLVVNWSLFFIALFAEVWILYHCDLKRCAFLAVSGVMVGLAVNIFFRCLIAIVMDRPLEMFDNNMTLYNLKQYPVLLGFLLTGVLLHVCRRTKLMENLKLVLNDSANLRFLLGLAATLYAYLALNLFLYYTNGNSLLLKLWGIKSCIFVLVGFLIGILYAARISMQNLYRAQNMQACRRLRAQEREQEHIQSIAFTDSLTGFYNRQYADEMLCDQVKNMAGVCLCFVDLDGLKVVNDEFGHTMGDHYLLSVAHVLSQITRKKEDILIRYGGDEFLVVFACEDECVAQRRMQEANVLLAEKNKLKEFPFSMSFSYGLAKGGPDSSMGDLIREADSKMYQHKHQRH